MGTLYSKCPDIPELMVLEFKETGNVSDELSEWVKEAFKKHNKKKRIFKID